MLTSLRELYLNVLFDNESGPRYISQMILSNEQLFLNQRTHFIL